MAPPNPRRTGYSRRAQYGTFFGYIAAAAGALVGAGFLIVSVFNEGTFAGARGIAAEVAAPAGKAVAAGRSGAQDAGAALSGWLTWGSTNAQMRRELEVARVRVAEARAIKEENARLKALLGLREGSALQAEAPVAAARLIGSTASSLRRFATLAAGRNEGVTSGMPVRSPLGLVGRVLDVAAGSSRVLLITDPESVVPVRRTRDGIPAFAQGHGDGTLQLRLVSLGINPLKPGDVFVTSGAGGLYRPNIAVGVVTALTADGAIARVLSDPTASEFVLVDRPLAEAVGAPQALLPVPESPAAPPPKHKPQAKPKQKAA